jgi:hypothetical protein
MSKPETEADKEREAWGFVGFFTGCAAFILGCVIYGLYCLVFK